MKKLIAFMLGVVMLISFSSMPIYADFEAPDDIEVYITVSDITNADDPFNIIADRIKLTVSYFDLEGVSDFVFNPLGLNVANSLTSENKITYLHAIYALHQLVYGNEEENLISNLYLDGNGDITMFFGKIVATMLYQNSKGVLEKPQCVELSDGDEINICLYDYGKTQSVAIFDELSVTVQRNEDVTLHLKEYLPDPEDDIPIEGAYLTDSDGVYLLDENKHIATTDENGEVTFNFSEGGIYKISVMPELIYYMDTGATEKETSKPEAIEPSRSVEVMHKYETRTVTYDNSLHGWYNLLDETADNYLDDPELQAVLLNYYEQLGEEPNPSIPVYICSWDDEEEETEVPLTKGARMIVRSTFEPEKTFFPVFTSDEPQLAVKYTMPFAVINVDATPVVEAQLEYYNDGHTDIRVYGTNTDTLERDGKMPVIRVARYNKSGQLIGWVGDRQRNYVNSAGDTFSVEGNEVSCVATNCHLGDSITVLCYDLSVDNGEPLNNDMVTWINQYEVTEENQDLTFAFRLREFQTEKDYKIVINKDGVATSQIIHIYEDRADWTTMSATLPKSVARSNGSVAFSFTTYPEDVDNDPDNDTVYKIFCWEWYENDTFVMGEPIIPPIILEPSTAQHESNRNNTR